MLVKKVTYFGEFGYLNSSCIRKKVLLQRFWVLREINSRFCSKTQWQMFLLVSGRHVGAHLDGHQHGVSIQISINSGKRFLHIFSIRKIAVTWILARVFAYLPSFFSQILDLICWTVFIFILINSEWHTTLKTSNWGAVHITLDKFENATITSQFGFAFDEEKPHLSLTAKLNLDISTAAYSHDLKRGFQRSVFVTD